MKVLNAYLEDESMIVAVHRDPRTGSVKGRRVRAEWVTYLARSEVSPDVERDLRKSRFVRSLEREGSWLRVGYVDRNARRAMNEDPRSPLRCAGIQPYEGDVHPVRRWVTDQGIGVDKPRACFLDIETDSRVPFSRKTEMRVLSWVVVDAESGEVFDAVLVADTDLAERELLEVLWQKLREYDQVFAWGSPFGDTFDFVVVNARSKQRGISIDPRRWLWCDYLQVFLRMNMHTAESGDEKDSHKLEDIAQSVLKEGKEKAPDFVRERFGDVPMGSISWDLWAAGGEFREALRTYMIKDAVLLRRIDQARGYAAAFQTVCQVCSVFGETSSLKPTRQMDGLLLKLGKQNDHRWPTKKFGEASEKFRGAYVMTPKARGILEDVHVGDFKGLYPSIIVTWNISPETRALIPPSGPVPRGFARAPITCVGFRNDVVGLLPLAVKELLDLRSHWKKQEKVLPPGTPEWNEAHHLSTAYKVVVNSFYGGAGAPGTRFFDRAVAESIAQAGVFLIQSTIKEAENRGMKAVYSDTDSMFILGSSRVEFEEFVKWCNAELYPRIVREHGCVENTIELDYEKQFKRIIFPLKSDGEASKKRYIASYAHFGGKEATADSEPEIKGIEYRRGDSSKLARNLQGKVIDMLVGGMNLVPDVPTGDVDRYFELLRKARDYCLRKPQLSIDEVKISQGLGRPLDDYVAKSKKGGEEGADGSHVAVGKILRSRGRDVREGTRVEYVVVDGSVSPRKSIPAEDYANDVDRYYLWERMVYPPTMRILGSAFPEHDWSAWSKARPPKPRGSSYAPEEQFSIPGVDMRSQRAAVLVAGPALIVKRMLRSSP